MVSPPYAMNPGMMRLKIKPLYQRGLPDSPMPALPSQSVEKFFVVIGMTSPKRPKTILPVSYSPILKSNQTFSVTVSSGLAMAAVTKPKIMILFQSRTLYYRCQMGMELLSKSNYLLLCLIYLSLVS